MAAAMDVRVAQNGRLVMPKAVREALGMVNGGTVIFCLDKDEVKVTSIAQGIKRAQDLYRRNATHDLSADDFIAERRAEAAREG